MSVDSLNEQYLLELANFIDESAYKMSYNEFILKCFSKGYEYKNYKSAYLEWNMKEDSKFSSSNNEQDEFFETDLSGLIDFKLKYKDEIYDVHCCTEYKKDSIIFAYKKGDEKLKEKIISKIDFYKGLQK